MKKMEIEGMKWEIEEKDEQETWKSNKGER